MMTPSCYSQITTYSTHKYAGIFDKNNSVSKARGVPRATIFIIKVESVDVSPLVPSMYMKKG